jgi:porphobilinogen synthase
MVRETNLQPDDLIAPLFVVHGEGVRSEIASMPGVYQLSVDQAVREAERARALGIPGLIFFGIPAVKDPLGSENYSETGIVQRTLQAVREACPELVLIADLCMCEYTDHGHCGVIRDGEIDNDATLEILGRAGLTYAKAGADFVAPSGMMDGMVGAIRQSLDAADYQKTGILSYSVKYASGFYGPFRDAAEGAPKFGDRRSHQMDPANGREALRELMLDIEEGADMVMVKPALPYLDVVARVAQASPVPVAAYNVSGEYAMIKAACANGWLDEQKVVLEALTGIKRAGADLILSYHAFDAARWLGA